MLKKILIFTTFFYMPLAMSQGGHTLYTDQIYKIQDAGHLTPHEAQERIYALKLQDDSDYQTMREQTRGVASAISSKKVIKFTNKAIEVFVD